MTAPNPFQPPTEAADIGVGVAPSRGRLHLLRLYSPNQVAFGTFLGTPLATGWLMAANFREMGKPHKATHALLLGAAATLAITALAFVLPEGRGSSVLTFAYTFAAREVAKRTQGQDFTSVLVAGGTRHSSWRVAGIAVLCVLAFVAACAVAGFAYVLSGGEIE